MSNCILITRQSNLIEQYRFPLNSLFPTSGLGTHAGKHC